eukprot:scaffold6601_cov72-Isochrysis_galbana.AAC.1
MERSPIRNVHFKRPIQLQRIDAYVAAGDDQSGSVRQADARGGETSIPHPPPFPPAHLSTDMHGANDGCSTTAAPSGTVTPWKDRSRGDAIEHPTARSAEAWAWYTAISARSTSGGREGGVPWCSPAPPRYLRPVAAMPRLASGTPAEWPI